MSVTDKIWDDSNADDIEKSLPEDAGFHRDIDLLTVKADQEGALRRFAGLCRDSRVLQAMLGHTWSFRAQFGASRRVH